MICSTLDRVFCAHCAFAPLCIKPQSQESINEKSATVKKQHMLKRKENLRFPKTAFKNLYAVQSGALKTYQIGADGKEWIRGFYFAGEILGYEAIYTNHYFFSATALTETVICEIPYDKILESLQTKPALQQHILYLISQQLNIGSYLMSTTAEQRLAAFLIDLSVRLHPLAIPGTFILPMSRQDIGNYLRLTAETISRIFSRLQKNKIIAIKHKQICFLQIEKLKQIADGLLTVTFLN